VSFRPVFIAVVIAFALIVSAFLVNRARPRAEIDQPSAAFVRASGKCAECHLQQQYSIVHEYEMSAHAQRGVNCLDCHQPAEGQQKKEHHGFVVSAKLTAGNCRACHEPIYQEYLHSRHAATSWAAVYGQESLRPEQVDFAERYQPGGARRPAHPLTKLEGPSSTSSGCSQCHSIGKPNDDGTVGMCTACHTRHTASVALAREPRACGQCHMGPDHSQIEIYEESRHGVMFAAQRHLLKLDAPPKSLSTRDMFVPTCATCHMSGLNGQKVTHDPSDRLSYYLADPITRPRPNHDRTQLAMKQLCTQCHTTPLVDRVYSEAEKVVVTTNEKVQAATAIVTKLREDGILTTAPFTQPIDFVYFDLWHYDGRTSKHGAFMGGADFVQWHGNYPMLARTVELKAMSDDLRRQHGSRTR
jgi:hydroxylamine dehydrogenase